MIRLKLIFYAVLILMFASGATILGGCGADMQDQILAIITLETSHTYSVGGIVSGLTGTLVLQNNGTNDLIISTNGAFTFTKKIAAGASYSVTINTQPVGQTCTARNSTGKITGANVTNVSVDCAADSATTPPIRMSSSFVVASGVVANPSSDTETPGKAAIGFDGNNFLHVSCRSAGSITGLYGVTLSGSVSGEVLNMFQILPHNCQFPRPAVAFDGTNYLVVFQLNGQIFGTRVSPDGHVLDGPTGFHVSSTGTSNWAPVVSFDGTNYLVAWQRFSGDYDIYGGRVTTGGQMLGEFTIFQAPGEQVEPAMAFDGNNSMVVWRDTRSGSGPSNDTNIFGTRVTKDGTVLDPTGIAVSTAPGSQGEPQIIYDGSNYFVVWNDERNSYTNSWSYMMNDIYGTRMKPDGTLLDGPADAGGIAINTAEANSGYVTVSFDGMNYFVVWSFPQYSIDPPAGIFAARVSTNGKLIDGPSTGTGISISGLPPSNSLYVYPAILFNGKNSLLTWVDNSAKDIDGITIYQHEQ